MAENSGIEWTDHTFNPWIGCTKVSPACDHCYAERVGARMQVQWGAREPRKRTSASNWNEPRRWNRRAEANGCRERVFCASLADVFDNEVPDAWRRDLFDLIFETPWLDWLVLTKRIGNVLAMIRTAEPICERLPNNVWLGISVVTQAEVDRDVPKLLAVPAARRFLSIEPMIGPIDLRAVPVSGSGHHEFDPIITANVLRRAERCWPAIDWVIAGGESGPHARPMHPDWPRAIRDQCAAAGVPFFFKQWGEWVSVSEVAGEGPHHRFDDGATLRRIGKRAAGSTLDGLVRKAWPA